MPQPASPKSSQIDLRPQNITIWINDLPRGSVGKTSELLYKALLQINQQDMKAGDRFRVLESLRESVQYATTNMSNHIKGSTYPLPEKIDLIANACQSTFQLMTHAYYSVFMDLKEQNSLFVDKGMLSTSIHRSIKYLQHSLLLVYKTYAAFHHDFWEQLHELYQYAENKNFSTTLIVDELLTTKRKSSIESEYIHGLLLHLAGPYHLRPGEIDVVNHSLEKWHQYVSLKKISDSSELVGYKQLFVIELDKDQPPFVMGKEAVTSEMNNCRFFETTTLIQELNKELKERIESKKSNGEKINSKTIRISLLRRLIESWGRIKKRRFPRNILTRKVNVTIGLHQTHMQLLYEQHVKKLISNKDAYTGFYTKPEFESIEVQDVNSKKSDVWSAVYAWTNVDVTKVDKTAPSQKQITDLRVKQENWTLLNESAEGFCVMSVEKQSNKIQVGEILSLQGKDSSQRSIGIVRWIKAYGENGIQIGGMLLAPSALSVSVSLTDPQNKKRQNQIIDRCLLLPLMQSLNRPATIMTFSHQYKIGDILELSQPDKKPVLIKLTKMVADNGLINQFLFASLDNSLSEVNEHQADTYNGIWKDL